MKTVPSIPVDVDTDPATKRDLEDLRNVMRRDDPFPDEAPELDWHDLDLDPLPAAWGMPGEDLSDDRNGAFGGWAEGAGW
jgi:hypothetical protein